MLSHCVPNATQLGVGVYTIDFDHWNDRSVFERQRDARNLVPCLSTCEDADFKPSSRDMYTSNSPLHHGLGQHRLGTVRE